MTNKEVTQKFFQGNTAKVLNLESQWSINTNNLVLVSYRTVIAIKVGNDVFITTKKYSVTTTVHTNLAIDACTSYSYIWEVENTHDCRWQGLKELFTKALEYQKDRVKELEKQLEKPKLRVQTKNKIRDNIEDSLLKITEIQARLEDFA